MMQKQKKQMILVVVLLLIFGSAYGGMRIYNQKQADKEEKEEEASKTYVTGVKKEDITAFSYQNMEETLDFVKEEDTWVLKNDESMKLDQSAVESMVNEIASLEAEEVLDLPEDISEYGFDKPENVITYTTDKGTVTLTVGMENTITNQYYLIQNEADSLYMVNGSFPSAFQKTAGDLEDTSEDSTETVVSETETE